MFLNEPEGVLEQWGKPVLPTNPQQLNGRKVNLVGYNAIHFGGNTNVSLW
jgi:hypothetical protein